ncbi:hypothetical protein [Roseimarinus sediminis]|uniref:hypothetical protein n=1 Tax=Roseimarinus sediminis TaxID=1610899 RepID=UPI003D217A1F
MAQIPATEKTVCKTLILVKLNHFFSRRFVKPKYEKNSRGIILKSQRKTVKPMKNRQLL